MTRPSPVPDTKSGFGGGTAWRQLLHRTRLEAAEVLWGAPFLVLLLLGLTVVVSFALIVGENRGASVYPLTYMMLRGLGTGLQMFLVITVVFLSGEMVHRERSLEMSQVCDALPVPTWVFLGSKLLTLILVVAVFIAAGIVSTVGVQISRGYFHLEPSLYARGFLAIAVPCMLLAVLSLCIQVLANNKFLGYLLMVVVLGLRYGMPLLGYEHYLLRYGESPGLSYSDMNGYGHFAEPFLWFNLYWGFAAIILLALSTLFWVRGTDSSFGSRLSAARRRWSGPVRIVVAVAALGLVASGAYIFYNTNILNDYTPRSRRIERLGDYERKYRQHEKAPLPRITAIQAAVDIFPEERRLAVRGTYRIENRGFEPIRLLPMTLSPRMDFDVLPLSGGITLERFDAGGQSVIEADEELGFYLYELDRALAPGEARELSFEVTAVNQGFKNSRPNNLVVGNGTLFTNRSFFPTLGYAPTNELRSTRHRSRQGLPPLLRMASVDDEAARDENYLHADWVEFETTVSTSVDQIALAPGHLEKEWVEGERRYFQYRAEAPIINFVVYMSAEYEVRRDRWRDVEIEVYHHPSHSFNIDRMVAASKSALEYLSSSLGPYPHRQLRIVEVPNYIGLTAFSLAGTIPFSESWGFIMRHGDDDIDFTTEVVAHEIAHQWWNHQVIPGNVQGATMIAETLSQYAGVMVMEKSFGQGMVNRYLATELDRYLAGRGDEEIQEMPLLLVENQPYIHYFKGSLVMYALKDYIGEEALNRALQTFFEAHVFKGPPYPTSVELLRHLREVVPEQYQYVIEDMFETITHFDNRAVEATSSEQADGTYLVKLQTISRKLRTNEDGTDAEIPIDDWIEIGVFGENESDSGAGLVELMNEKRLITEPNMTFEVLVHQRPVQAGIDPYHRLIDRDSNDNLVRVSISPQ